MSGARVPTQLIPPKEDKSSGRDSGDKVKDTDADADADEVEESSGAGAIVGYSGPMGASSEDMGDNPVSPGGRLRRRRPRRVDWK